MATRFSSVASVNLSYAFNRTAFTGQQGTAPHLWNYTYQAVTSSSCFKGAGNTTESISNFNSIPSAWGGPA